MEEKDMSMIGSMVRQNPVHSTYPSRGALDRRLGSGVPNAVLHGVKRHQWVAEHRELPTLRHNLAKAEAGLGNARPRWHLTSLWSAIACTPPPWQVWGGLGYNANGLDVKV
jgi:hypothetical protein